MYNPSTDTLKTTADGVQFDEHKMLHALKHYLPTQTPLKDFIHHNSLHAFQEMKFFDAIFKAAKIFGYQVTLQLSEFRELYKNGRIRPEILDRIIIAEKGQENLESWKDKLLSKEYDVNLKPRIGRLRANWKSQYKIDLDNLVQPLLFRVLCSYLDQGISLFKFPRSENGFLESLRELERHSHVSIFRSRKTRELLLNEQTDISRLLHLIVGEDAYFEQYLFDQQFSHRGWSGITAAIESMPGSLLDERLISLKDLIIFELLLELDALYSTLGNNWRPLAYGLRAAPYQLLADTPLTELNNVLTVWQHAFEWSYYDEVLAGLAATRSQTPSSVKSSSFQAMFCIDERECSLRRHIEQVDKTCETLGTPGFFGVEFYFQPENGKFYDKLCPAPVTPKYLIKESGVNEERKHELLYTPRTHSFIRGSLSTLSLGFLAGGRLLQNIFSPKMSPAISNAFAHMHPGSALTIENFDLESRENGLQIGFTIDEMTTRVEGLLRGVGLIKNFAPFVYAIAHGSSSANNPHHGAHDCGACSGRPGSVNSRVFAFMANHSAVREKLKERGIDIPPTTVFIGGLHDTAADQIQFFDADKISAVQAELHKQNIDSFEEALDLNAKERSRRFASIKTKTKLKTVRKAILDRSVSMFEPRPELGHGTNTLCVIGGRYITKDLFLDRRAFLNSYDYRTDPEGKLLTGIMRPIGPVCGGINLEYYFSRVDNYKLGAGTKLPHNVMGLFGVANSSDGDLRPGLPLQMIEVHDPVRLLVIVEHHPEVVLNTIKSAPEMYEWYINEWVHLMVLDPGTGRFYYFREGSFAEYVPLADSTPVIVDFNSFVESAREMETNRIADATKENLPVYSIK